MSVENKPVELSSDERDFLRLLMVPLYYWKQVLIVSIVLSATLVVCFQFVFPKYNAQNKIKTEYSKKFANKNKAFDEWLRLASIYESPGSPSQPADVTYFARRLLSSWLAFRSARGVAIHVSDTENGLQYMLPADEKQRVKALGFIQEFNKRMAEEVKNINYNTINTNGVLPGISLPFFLSTFLGTLLEKKKDAVKSMSVANILRSLSALDKKQPYFDLSEVVTPTLKIKSNTTEALTLSKVLFSISASLAISVLGSFVYFFVMKYCRKVKSFYLSGKLELP